jgi:hypothetical protein
MNGSNPPHAANGPNTKIPIPAAPMITHSGSRQSRPTLAKTGSNKSNIPLGLIDAVPPNVAMCGVTLAPFNSNKSSCGIEVVVPSFSYPKSEHAVTCSVPMLSAGRRQT